MLIPCTCAEINMHIKMNNGLEKITGVETYKFIIPETGEDIGDVKIYTNKGVHEFSNKETEIEII